MLSIARSERLRGLGWKLLLQVSLLLPVAASTRTHCSPVLPVPSMQPAEAQVGGVQVHDEVIVEGPQDSVLEAQQLVVQCMGSPFNGTNPLGCAARGGIDLLVDAKHADTWLEAK